MSDTISRATFFIISAETAEEVEPSSPTRQEIAAEIHSRRFRE